MSFNLADFPEVCFIPTCFTGHSAWHEHIPMVPVLLSLLRPKTFVELGTHAGDSYMAFCQCVTSLSLNTHCTAIDSWKGDVHTGAYSSTILAELRAAHDPLYGSFSRLMQSDFDGAVGSFGDGSIDLLHIDGAHDYTSVRHDFDTWLPKLSPRGVALFHDTAERQPEFGVWKVWDEVCVNRPHASVPYGHGLGILAVGPEVPAAFIDFLSALSNSPGLATQFGALGQRLQVLFDRRCLAEQLHYCQSVANEWRTRTGQAIRNPTPNQQLAFGNPVGFGQIAAQDVHQLAVDALSIAAEVTTLRQKVGGHPR